MGEIADAMINGELCAMCGVCLEENDMEIPMYCSLECARAQEVPEEDIESRILKSEIIKIKRE